MENKSSTKILVNIICEVFGDQLLIWLLFQEIIVEGQCMVFEVFKDKRPDWVDFTFLHQHKQELNCLDYTLFAISFVSCVTGIHKGQPFGGLTLFFTPPYTFLTKFIFAEVDVIIRTGVTNVCMGLFLLVQSQCIP
jgi:hypothetical protein